MQVVKEQNWIHEARLHIVFYFIGVINEKLAGIFHPADIWS